MILPWFSHDFPRCRCFPPVFSHGSQGMASSSKRNAPASRSSAPGRWTFLGGVHRRTRGCYWHVLALASCCFSFAPWLVLPGIPDGEILRNNVAKEDMILELLLGRWGWTPFSGQDKKCPSGHKWPIQFCIYCLPLSMDQNSLKQSNILK